MSLLCLLLTALLPPLILSGPVNITHLTPTIIQNTLHRSIHINAATHAGARVAPCGRSCRFRLCNFNGAATLLPRASFVILNDINHAALPFVCLPTPQLIGEVRSASPAHIVSNGRLIPLPSFTPSGLNASFSRKLFRTTKIPFLPFSGISRRLTTGNQWQFLHDRCLTLPVRYYRPLEDPNFTPGQRVNASSSPDSCVAFRTTAATIQVQLTWDSNDDFDVIVTEPDGDTVSRSNSRTEAGRLVDDSSVGICDSSLTGGSENILYLPGGPIETGTYSVRARHFNVCTEGTTTNWRLTVVIGGERVLILVGQSGTGGNQLVADARFTFSG